MVAAMMILEKRPFALTDTAVCIGKFDGLHSGHRLLTDSISRYDKLKKVLFTFSFGDVPGIYSSSEKRYVAEKLGIDIYIDCPFDEELSHMPPEVFLEKVLVGECGAKVISVGEDFRFGYNRQGDVGFLRKNSVIYGYELNVFPKKRMYGDVVSSTRIRYELENGSIERVNALLGHPYLIYGEVCHGNRIGGRKFHMPTANQILPSEKILPPFGVYASQICIDGHVYHGVTNIGVKPTIPGVNQAGAETYIMGFDSDLYGKNICVELCAFLRSEKKFPDMDALMAQMEEDKNNAYLFFKQ